MTQKDSPCRRQGESQDSDSSLHQNQNEALQVPKILRPKILFTGSLLLHDQGVKLAQETLTALQAKRAELSVGPSPSPRVGLDHDEDDHNHAAHHNELALEPSPREGLADDGDDADNYKCEN